VTEPWPAGASFGSQPDTRAAGSSRASRPRPEDATSTRSTPAQIEPSGRSVASRGLDGQQVAIARLDQLDSAVVCANADNGAIETPSGLAVRSGWRGLGNGCVDPADHPVPTTRGECCNELGVRAVRRHRSLTLDLCSRRPRVGSVTVARHAPRLPAAGDPRLSGWRHRTMRREIGRSVLVALGGRGTLTPFGCAVTATGDDLVVSRRSVSSPVAPIKKIWSGQTRIVQAVRGCASRRSLCLARPDRRESSRFSSRRGYMWGWAAASGVPAAGLPRRAVFTASGLAGSSCRAPNHPRACLPRCRPRLRSGSGCLTRPGHRLRPG
jgi:hypothetical protein